MSSLSMDMDDEFEQQGLSDSDMSALDGIWTTLDGEVVENGPVIDLELPARPEAAEPAGLEVAKDVVDIEGDPGVFPWDSASREEIAKQWPKLREFVEWAVQVYRLPNAEHLPCWWKHPEIVLIWVAIRHLFVLSWDREDAGGGPNNFHYWFGIDRNQLRAAWSEHKATCTKQTHTDPAPVHTEPTHIDETEWAELTGASTPYRSPEQWPFRPLTAASDEAAEPVDDTEDGDAWAQGPREPDAAE